MNDIERQIEGIEGLNEKKEITKETHNIKNKSTRNKDEDKKRKIIIYIIIGLVTISLIALLIYNFFNNGNAENNIDDNNNDEVVNGELDNTEEETNKKNLGYVSCDDNTALLNVRNGANGNIIDGLSCYKEVTIEEELDGTETCSKWYKISYIKNGSNYTGYSCSKYIKKLDISESVLNSIRTLIDKANDYYENNILKAYCGNTSDIKTIEFPDGVTGEYVKSEYKNIDELKNYLLSFLDKNLIDSKLELSDINSPKYNDNYYLIDGNLYCRNYSNKGWMSRYTNNYNIEITDITDDKISVNIAYEYIKEDSDCDMNDLAKCSKSDFVYEFGKIIIENNIITNMNFHN